MHTRRAWLAGAVSAGLLPLATAHAAQTQTLKGAAARAGLLFGSDSDIPFSKAAPGYQDLFLQQCALYAPNLSWSGMSPKAGVAPLGGTDPNVAVAIAHGLRLTGAHLLWYRRTPQWFESMTDPDQMRDAIYGRVKQMADLYGNHFYSWNVANEAIAPEDGRPDGLRNTVYSRLTGDDFIDWACRASEAMAPQVRRVYNDFALERDRPDDESKREALLRLLDRLQKRGTPLEAIGIQSHLGAGYKFSETVFRDFLAELAGRGLKIIISELDITDGNYDQSDPVRDQIIADVYTRYLNVSLDQPAVKAVVTWGLCDGYNWNNLAKDQQHHRKDGRAFRPLPFDADLQPKPAFNAILSAFQSAPVRQKW